MTFSTSDVAACCSSASSRSRLSRAIGVWPAGTERTGCGFGGVAALWLQGLSGLRFSLLDACFKALFHCLHPRTEGKPSYRVRAAPAMGWARLRYERQKPSRHLPSGIHLASASHTRIALKFTSFYWRLVVIPLTDMRTCARNADCSTD